MAAKLRTTPLLVVLLLALASALAVWLYNREPTPPTPHLADLGSPPDWSRLDPYQDTITKTEFLDLLENIYTIGPAWEKVIAVTNTKAEITTRFGDPEAPPYHLTFASRTSESTPPRYWKSASSLGPAPADKPLQGLRIALDPGHIGGQYARMEERWFQLGEDTKPVMEGEMTLLTARHLKTRLESLGATVDLLRNANAPVTTKSVEEFETYARENLGKSTPHEVRSLAERLFYRTAEIRARADIVNQKTRPDLVLCLHFNAEGWGNPLEPQLSPRNHFHVLLNGAYTAGEVTHDDERFEMLLKIAQRIHPEEKAIATGLISAFQEVTTLPPYEYEPLSLRAINIDHNPYLWARNLLANRLYECPVLFLEPYVMNSEEVFARVQAGDYDGQQEVNGVQRLSIYQEYAHAVALGLERYYRQHRAP